MGKQFSQTSGNVPRPILELDNYWAPAGTSDSYPLQGDETPQYDEIGADTGSELRAGHAETDVQPDIELHVSEGDLPDA